MQLYDRRARRLALALAVPALALGAIALTTTSAASSTPTVAGVQLTEAPGNGTQTGGGGGGGTGTTGAGTITKKTTTGTKTTTTTKSTTPSKSASATPSGSKSASARPSGSASGGPSGGASGGAGGGGAVLPGNAGCGMNPTQPITIKTGQAGGKTALVDANGCSVYLNNKDTASSSACDATCQQQWVPVPGPAQAGEGLQQTNFATFSRADGSTQATYYGHQLYWYTGDTAPGQANGQAMDQTWYLIDPSGNPITS